MSSINLKDYFQNPDVKFNNANITKNKPPIELLLPSFILYLVNKPENATDAQLIYHLDSHTFSGSKITNQNIFTSNFEDFSLIFEISDQDTIEINTNFQVNDTDLQKLINVINTDIELKNEYNLEQKQQLYHIINCKRLLYALTEYNKIRSSNKDEKNLQNNLKRSSLGNTLTSVSNENPSDESLQTALQTSLEENLKISELYNVLEKSIILNASTANTQTANTQYITDDSNKKILLMNTTNSPNYKNMTEFFTLIVDTNYKSKADSLKTIYLNNNTNILSFYKVLYDLEIPNGKNVIQLSLNPLEKIKENILSATNVLTGGSLINELDYQLHTTMYILKMIKLLVYRHVFFKQYELVNKDYLIEVFVNVCLFFIFTNGDIDHMVCYIIDQIAVMATIFTYIRVCEKENWNIDINIISGIILSPVYLVVC